MHFAFTFTGTRRASSAIMKYLAFSVLPTSAVPTRPKVRLVQHDVKATPPLDMHDHDYIACVCVRACFLWANQNQWDRGLLGLLRFEKIMARRHRHSSRSLYRWAIFVFYAAVTVEGATSSSSCLTDWLGDGYCDELTNISECGK